MESAAAIRLSTALERITRLLRGAELPGTLSSVAASTLYTLANEGPKRLTALAIAEHVTQPAMTQLVRRLESEGLVERRDDPGDGRAVLVAATSAGAALSAERRAARAEALGRVLDDLSPDERAALAAAVPALERLASVPSGMVRAATTARRTAR